MSDEFRSRYPGTSPFDDSPEDVSRFFGRDAEAEELYLRVLSVPLLVQFGTSGLGKTSLLQAGLFPRLRQKPFLPVMVRLNTAEDSLLESVVRSFQKSCEIEGLKFVAGDTSGLWEFLSTTTIFRDDLLLTPVLVFDQFEEVFTLRDSAFRALLAAELGALAGGQKPRRPNVKIVISLREDYVGSLEEFSAAIPGLFQERLRLERFSERAARDAVTRPAQLDGPFDSPKFELDPAALDALIQYLRGKSGIIEPIQLQLLCRHAESIARAKAHPVLTLNDFRGKQSFASVLENFYRDTLHKLAPHQRRRAARLCEVGLLGSEGHRLMLEERQIERDFGVRPGTLQTLTQEKLIRREQRMESAFYEISHDRLAESIFNARSARLPKSVRQALWIAGVAAVVVVGLLTLFNVRVARERDRAQDLIGFLIGEQFLGEVRDIGSSALLQQVQEHIDVDASKDQPPLLRALALRGRGDVKRLQGDIAAATSLYQQALKTFDPGADDADSLREVARAHQRLAEAIDQQRTLDAALAEAETASAAWRRVVAKDEDAEWKFDDCVSLADSLLIAGTLKDRLGQGDRALLDADAAVTIVSHVLFGPENETDPCGPVTGEAEPYPDAEALQVLSRAALLRANVLSTGEDYEGAATLAREARALKPASTSARKYALYALSWRAYAAGDQNPQQALNDYRQIQREAEEMRRWDPGNRAWQRERAITLQMVGRGIGFCHQRGTCAPMPRLEEAEAVILEAIATLRTLAQLDPNNVALQADIFWALLERADVLALEPNRAAEQLDVLEHAAAIHRKLQEDAESVAMLGYLQTRLASTFNTLGQTEEAARARKSAIAAWTRVTKEHPQHPLYRIELLRLTADASAVDAAEKEARNLGGDAGALTAGARIRRSPADPAGYATLSAAYKDRVGKTKDSARQLDFRNAALQAAQIAAWLAPRAQERANLLSARMDFGIFLNEQNRNEDALGILIENVAVAEMLVDEEPQTPAFHGVLGASKCMVGLVRRELKQDGWEEALRGGIIHIQKATTLNAERYFDDLGAWQRFLGVNLIAEGRTEEGNALMRAALASYLSVPPAGRTEGDTKAISDLTELTKAK